MTRLVLILLALTNGFSVASAAPPDPTRVGASKVVGDLQLTATVDPDLQVSLELRDVGKKPIQVASHIKTYELHYDWFEIELTWPMLDAKGACTATGRLVLKLFDDRDGSEDVYKTLAPNEALVHRIDVPRWAARKINGAVTLGGGFYKVVARYRVDTGAGLWHGVLETAPAKIVALDQARVDMCKTNPGWDRF